MLCKVDNEFYYCYNINEMLYFGFVPINIRFENGYFLWELTDNINQETILKQKRYENKTKTVSMLEKSSVSEMILDLFF